MRRHAVNCTCWGTLAACLFSSSMAGAAEPWVEAAHRRTEAIKTARIEFRLTETWMPGCVSQNWIWPTPSPKKIPEVETTESSDNVLVFDGVKVRYEDNHPRWRIPEGVLLQSISVNVTNGEIGKAYYPNGVGRTGKPQGFICDRAEADLIKSDQLLALTINLRGLDPSISPYLLMEAKRTGVRQSIDGDPCEECTIVLNKDKGLVASLWIDPERDFVVRRIRTLRQGRVIRQVNVQFQKDNHVGWLPAEWVRTQFDSSGRVLQTSTGVVTGIRINESVPNQAFEVLFPEGCLVHDRRSGKDYRVLPNGMLKQVSPFGEDLDSVIPQPGMPWYTRNKWLLVGAGVSLVALVMWLVLTRMRHRAEALAGG
jgi:hypothetical protein